MSKRRAAVPLTLAAATALALPAAAHAASGETAAVPLPHQAAFLPAEGSTVGVGMPVSFHFDKPVADRKAVQSAITVVSSSGQRVVGHWFGRNRLDFRPSTYWKPGSEITVKISRNGIPATEGIAGSKNEIRHFRIGRSQISTVDVTNKTMTVVRDGITVRTIPISAGAPETPTYNGQMVISQKERETRMNGATVGFTDKDDKPAYDIPDVPHALRLSSSGTFVHGNYWANKGVFGTANTSHGCIGLSDTRGGQDPSTPAAWFYDHSLIGDVVIVKNSGDKTIRPDNGFGDWNLTWNQWKAGSAV